MRGLRRFRGPRGGERVKATYVGRGEKEMKLGGDRVEGDCERV